MTRCTWKDCAQDGKHEMKERSGEVWARLCDAHRSEIDAAIDAGLKAPDGDPTGAKKLLRCWVLASGGPKTLSDRLAPGAERVVKELGKVASILGRR